MNYPVPHHRRRKTVRDSYLEDLCYVDLHHSICKPFFNYKSNFDQEDKVSVQVSSSIVQSNPPKATLPFPVFSPSPVCCGRGPEANNIICPNDYPSKLLDLRIKFECRRIASYNRGFSKSHLVNKLKRNNKIPSVLQGVRQILCRYSSVEKYPSNELSFAGGNLNSLLFEGKQLFIHSTPEHDGTLGFTQLNNEADYPAEMGTKMRLEDGGLVFQICVPRHSPDVSGTAPIFLTRQLETSTLWNISRDDDGELAINKLHYLIDDSLVRCVDMSPFIRTEWCELRTDALTVSRQNERTYRRYLDSADYRHCQWANHPQVLLLSRDKSMELLDLRVPMNSPMSTLLSLRCERFLSMYNLVSSENICCVAPTTEAAGYLFATDKSVAIADLRMNSRLLYKMAHLMNTKPQFANIVAAPIASAKNDPAQWTFLTSVSSDASATVVHRWSSVQLASTPVQGLSLRTPLPLHEPVRRPDLADTLEKLQQRGFALDWTVQNRLKQPVTGQMCHYSNQAGGTGLIRILTCTASGDVYIQHIDPIKSDGTDPEPVDWPWLGPWMNAVRDIEQKSKLIQASEIFDGDQILCRLLKQRKGSNGDGDNSEEERHEEQDPEFVVPVALRYPFEDPEIHPVDSRGADYLKVFEQQAPITAVLPESDQPPPYGVADLQLDDSFSHDFEVDLISSTPYQRPVASGSCVSASQSWMPSVPPKNEHFDWGF